MENFYLESITPQHEKLMSCLGNLFPNQVLIGGTALALQIGHRQSEDLDFVIFKPIPKNIHHLIVKRSNLPITKQLVSTEQQYTAYVGDTKITFFHDPLKFLHPTKTLFNTKLASIHDIFSSKLYVLSRRAAWRDYIDIAILLREHNLNLEKGIKEAKLRHNVEERWILEPMTYFDDVPLQPVKYLRKEYSVKEVQEILIKAAKNYTQTRLKSPS